MKGEPIVFERRFVPEGALILKQGDAGNCAYLIQSGSVSIFAENKGKQVELSKLGLGEIFGEMALIFDEPRSASAIALEDCNLVVLTRDVLQQKINRSDPTLKSIIKMLTRRIVSKNKDVMDAGDNSIREMTETARFIYENVLSNLDGAQQKDFQEKVLPKLETFLDAVRSYDDGTANK